MKKISESTKGQMAKTAIRRKTGVFNSDATQFLKHEKALERRGISSPKKKVGDSRDFYKAKELLALDKNSPLEEWRYYLFQSGKLRFVAKPIDAFIFVHGLPFNHSVFAKKYQSEQSRSVGEQKFELMYQALLKSYNIKGLLVAKKQIGYDRGVKVRLKFDFAVDTFPFVKTNKTFRVAKTCRVSFLDVESMPKNQLKVGLEDGTHIILQRNL